jgi:hypothetical protein
MARILMTVPGVFDPPVASAEATTIRDDADIAGLEVNGRHRAYCLSEMDSPSTHVINDLIDHIPVTVTYCNITRCVRVFTKPEQLDKPLNVSVRGFAGGQLVVQVDDADFSQNSADIPLKELGFERTTWGAWKSAYPDTDVCTGLQEFSNRPDREVFMMMRMGRFGSFSLPGIVDPPVQPADSATIQDDAEIVGLEVNGLYRAYCLSEMGSPSTHIVNDLIDHVPVTVTYCNITGCVRVFTKPEEPDRPLTVCVRGFVGGQMLVQVDNTDFSQNSADIPLPELEFQRTCWGEWKSAHPDTDVCTGLHESVNRQRPTLEPVNRDSGGDTSHAGE